MRGEGVSPRGFGTRKSFESADALHGGREPLLRFERRLATGTTTKTVRAAQCLDLVRRLDCHPVAIRLLTTRTGKRIMYLENCRSKVPPVELILTAQEKSR